MDKKHSSFVLFSKKLTGFLIVWLLVGFPVGSGFLMGPVRWVVTFSRQSGWSQDIENILVRILIILCIIISFLMSLYFYKRSRTARFVVLVVLNIILLLTWLNPRSTDSSGIDNFSVRMAREGFYFGSYPDLNNLNTLKDEGFTAVISLLHPAVLPMEPLLIEREEANAKKAGINLIHLPMLPWVGKNDASLQSIVELVKSGGGKKYYVHCYLGKDRVNLAQKVIQGNNGIVINDHDQTTHRTLMDQTNFTLGKVIQLDKDAHLTPFPSNENFMSYILGNNTQQIVSFVNSEDRYYIDSAKHNNYAKKFYPAYKKIQPHMYPYDPFELTDTVAQIKKMPRPLVIYVYQTKSPIGQALELTYKTGKPSLPPLLFTDLSHAEKINAVSNNAIAGDTPTLDDLNAFFSKGVRKIAYVGSDVASPKITSLKQAANRSGLIWVDINLLKDNLSDMINDNSTWYIFGADNAKIAELLPT